MHPPARCMPLILCMQAGRTLPKAELYLSIVRTLRKINAYGNAFVACLERCIGGTARTFC
jgi:hypothetical protein